MKKIKTVASFLVLAVFLIANVPLQRVGAADVGDLEVFQETELTAEDIPVVAFSELDGVDMSKITLNDVPKSVKYGDTITLEATAGEGTELTEKIVVDHTAVNSNTGFGSSTSEYTLVKDKDGKFKTDIYIHKYMPEGKHWVESVTVYDKNGKKVGYEYHNGDIKYLGASINIEGKRTLDIIDIELISKDTNYGINEFPELSIDHTMTELDYLVMEGNILIKNMDSDTDAADAYVRFRWDKDQQKFIIEDFIGLMDGEEVYQPSLTPGRYFATGILFNWQVIRGNEVPDIEIRDKKVIFTVDSPPETRGFIVEEVKFPREFVPGQTHTLSFKIRDTEERNLGDANIIYFPISTVGANSVEIPFKNVGDGWYTGTYTPHFYSSPVLETYILLISEENNGKLTKHAVFSDDLKHRLDLRLGNKFGAKALGLKVEMNKQAYAVGEYIKLSFNMNKWEEKLNYALSKKNKPQMSYVVIRHESVDADRLLHYARITRDMKSGKFNVDTSKLKLEAGEYIIEEVIFMASDDRSDEYGGRYTENIIPISPINFIVDGTLPRIKGTTPELSQSEDILKVIELPEASMENVEKVDVSLSVEEAEFSEGNIEKLQSFGHIFMVSNIKLMKNIKYTDGTEGSSVIDNADIKGEITLKMAAPEDFDTDLNPLVIYVGENGELEEKETWLVQEGEDWFIYFKTDHFSTYVLVGVNEVPVDEEPVDEEPVDEEPVDEEPVDEEPVDEEPVDEEPTKDKPTEVEKPVEETEKETAKDDKLPEAGVGSTLGYSLSGILFSGAGLALIRKKQSRKQTNN